MIFNANQGLKSDVVGCHAELVEAFAIASLHVF